MAAGRIRVVGLGPAGPDLVTAGTLAAIEATPRRFVRTRRHPAVEVLGAAAEVVAFDDLYDAASTMDEVYGGIVDRLVEAAADGDVLYAVPGSPLVAERTVQLLLADPRADCEVLAALSFLDLLWVRLGIDPMAAGVQVVDGHDFAAEAAGASGPLVVCQCDSPLVLSDIKLAVEDWPEDPVTVVQRLGLPDERIVEVDWADLDRVVEADHLTSLYVPSLAAPVATELVRLDELVHTLRAGCPWDAEQTHDSLKRYLLEESYELLAAIDALSPEASALAEPTPEAVDELCEELGDVLFQVVFHATIAAESGWFTLADVAREVHDKLHRRHPHVFGDAGVTSTEELTRSWEAAKQAEKGRASVFEGIPATLPALLEALKVRKKAATVGVEVAPDLGAAAAAAVASPDAATVGELLSGVVEVARRAGVDPEDALRRATARFRATVDA